MTSHNPIEQKRMTATSGRTKMATKTKTGLAAIVFTIVSFLFIIISFSTPCWLETDGKIEDPKFIRIGKIFLELITVN